MKNEKRYRHPDDPKRKISSTQYQRIRRKRRLESFVHPFNSNLKVTRKEYNKIRYNSSLAFRDPRDDNNRLSYKDYINVLKDLVLEKYGHECALCGITDQRVLVVDHIHGRANSRVSSGLKGWKLYKWMVENPKADDLRILCCNCNYREYLRKKDGQ